MMTVVYKPMRRRRWMRIEAGQAPPTWKTFPMHDKGANGSAKPGRGGRRKRKARRGAERVAYQAARIGRRERRRRAKLRRRRARRAGWTTITAPPGLWRALAKSWALNRMQRADLDRMSEMFGVKRTPGA
jgi:hypothetical protein